MSPVNKDEKSLAIAIALAACVLVYILGALALIVLDSMIGFSDGVVDLLSVMLLLGSMMAAAVILLREKSRRT